MGIKANGSVRIILFLKSNNSKFNPELIYFITQNICILILERFHHQITHLWPLLRSVCIFLLSKWMDKCRLGLEMKTAFFPKKSQFFPENFEIPDFGIGLEITRIFITSGNSSPSVCGCISLALFCGHFQTSEFQSFRSKKLGLLRERVVRYSLKYSFFFNSVLTTSTTHRWRLA